ncbi:MAG: hypothetical protein ACJ74Z_22210 [Bryobacteraceae bacterium]
MGFLADLPDNAGSRNRSVYLIQTRESRKQMQEETTREKVHITEIAAWEFKVDGSVVPKTLQVDITLLKGLDGKSPDEVSIHIYGMTRSGFERFVDLGTGGGATIIFRKSESGEFTASIWETEMFYFENLLALMEFFRRYGEFFRAVSESSSAGSLRGISSALQEKEKR